MSDRFPGGFITKTPVVPTPSSASGVWTLDQQLQAQKSGTWPFGGPFVYIEDVFSTYLYTGNDTSQSINNGIDLSTYGGLAWIKARSTTGNNNFYDTLRGTNKLLYSNSTSAQVTGTDGLNTFNSNGFSLGASGAVNSLSVTYASWTFRKQPKFFDVVTYTGNGANRSIAHSLGSTPGCVIVKSTSLSSDWAVWHRSLPGATSSPYAGYAVLNTTAAAVGAGVNDYFDGANMTSTTIGISTSGTVNSNGQTYVAYIFAHDAGGFGLTGTDNVISCGSFTTDGSGNATVNLGYEPQWILTKPDAAGYGWNIADTMRGMSQTSVTMLSPNTSAADNTSSGAPYLTPTATGFSTTGYWASQTLIYIAIRRGPMKTPTSGTSVFALDTYGRIAPSPGITTAQATPTFKADWPVDMGFFRYTAVEVTPISSRLTGTGEMYTWLTNAEGTNALQKWDFGGGYYNDTSTTTDYTGFMFRRAPGFFDEVCYTGNGAASNNQTHNLGVMPEMCILRRRNGVVNWQVVHQAAGTAKTLALNLTNSSLVDSTMSANFTSTYFKTADGTCWFEGTNGNTFTYVAYLFASCPGVSKVGSYTGTGTTKQIDCGFTGGARFVLIKRTDSTGDWYFWNSLNGIVAGNDPYWLMNSSAGLVTNTDYVDTYNAGFEISSTAPAAINANGGTFIFLAIA